MIGAVILAAGASDRLGRPKALLPLAGTNFLEHIMAVLKESGIRQICVVLAHNRAVIQEHVALDDVTVVTNPEPERGQLSSLQLALETPELAEAEAMFVCLIDQPFITAPFLGQILQAHADSEKSIVVPTFQGRGGHPTLFARSLFDELLNAPLSAGARQVIRAHPEDVLRFETDREDILCDIDTPEDYERWVGEPLHTPP